MYIKQGVSLLKLQAAMLPAIAVCIDFFDTIGKDFVITSGDDGKHKTGSLHYQGLAFDVRSRELIEKEKFAFKVFFSHHVSTCFELIIEKDHFHIEYDESVSETAWP